MSLSFHEPLERLETGRQLQVAQLNQSYLEPPCVSRLSLERAFPDLGSLEVEETMCEWVPQKTKRVSAVPSHLCPSVLTEGQRSPHGMPWCCPVSGYPCCASFWALRPLSEQLERRRPSHRRSYSARNYNSRFVSPIWEQEGVQSVPNWRRRRWRQR